MAPTQTRLETQVMDAEGKHPPNIEHGCGSLHVACMRGDLESVGILLESGDYSLSERCAHGGTPLTYAAWNTDKAEIIHLLLQDPVGREMLNEQDNDGFTPLICAVYGNNPNVVEALLSYPNIDVFVKEDVHGDTALDKAEGGNRQTCTQLLLDYIDSIGPSPPEY